MEEWVGERWHRLITRAADASHADAAVTLEQVTRSVQLLFRAGGGDALVRVVPATARRIGGPRGWLQRHGYWSLLLAWVPVVGDPLCLLAGWLRWSFWWSSLLILLGKTARYLLVILLSDLLV